MVVLKKCAIVLAPCVVSIADRCLVEGKFPHIWKKAIVCPIPKKDGSSSSSDYRPISLLSPISKLAKSLINQILLNEIEPHLSKSQFGFRQNSIRRNSTLSKLRPPRLWKVWTEQFAYSCCRRTFKVRVKDSLSSDQRLEQVTSYRYLGIEIDEDFNFAKQTHAVSLKAKRAIGMISRQIRKWASKKILEISINVFAVPALLYAIEVWYPPGEKEKNANRKSKQICMSPADK